ncbi:hypothetical protein KW798_00380 [Candidatus Parcubacteria bacterium]|nr:hypothetical protein [Candidatus Parcubacteria bacterium]
MNKQTYYALTSIIFGVLAVLHAARLYYGWPANIGGFDIPVWISWFALAIAGYLSMRGWMFVQHKGR